MSAASQRLASSDPTGTKSQRSQWVREYNRRWRRVRGRIREELQNNARLHPDADRSTGRQTREFRDFLERVIDEEVVEPMSIGGVINGSHHSGPPTREAFISGVLLGNAHLRRADFDVDSVSYNQAEQLLQYPHYREPLQDRYEHVYTDLVDIGEATHTEASRNYREQVNSTGSVETVLTGPTQTSDGVQDRISKRGSTGTQRLAQSQVVTAANLGALYHYQDAANVETVGAVIEIDTEVSSEEGVSEWTTVGDSRVCSQCESLAGNQYKISEILQGNAPLPAQDTHANCRCFYTAIR